MRAEIPLEVSVVNVDGFAVISPLKVLHHAYLIVVAGLEEVVGDVLRFPKDFVHR